MLVSVTVSTLNQRKMTRSAWVLVSAIAVITTLETFKNRTICTIHGSIHPAMALRKIWVIQDGDTLSTRYSTNTFSIDVKPGPYVVWIDAIAPYRDIQYDNNSIGEGKDIELGNIELVQ
jgi:hypothetical protein